MGLWDKIKGQLIDVIEWLDDSRDTLVYRFERQGNEIKNGAKLIVREGQNAVFVNQGQIADCFYPGTYELETKNLPILSTLQAWPHGFNSPFKAEVYFVSTRQFTDLKWGTKNPIMVRDPEFGPVRLRAFGTYAVRVGYPETFIQEIVGTNAHFTTDDIIGQLRNIIVARFSDAVAEQKVPLLDLASNYDELGTRLTDLMAPDIQAYGLELTSLLIENISLPPEVEKALDKRSSMGILGDMNKYTQFQTAEAIEKAASQPVGSAAAQGMGMGMGFAMANQMGQAIQQPAPAPAAAAPPPLPQAKSYHIGVNNQQLGPFDMNALAQHVANGTLTRETLVWTSGMANWTKASEVADLASLFGSTPPPLPPS
ncbi:MAG: SPFH domain-containing protein [Acidobacteria bacterium]|nr:SPFH domain-containing protein [Acidobacteriota bacterium]